ncbi:MAG: hypothetical protein ABEJ07_00060 [Candidatus Nanohaloarchaea archaeon]
MELADFPPETRLKLDEEGDEKLWNGVEDAGGVRSFCEGRDLSESQLYSCRSRDIYIPLSLVSAVLGREASRYVVAYKGGGRSRPVVDPVLPVPRETGLLTRVQESVVVNSDGVPFYIADEYSLVRRFRTLLSVLGEVPASLYRRSRYELRLPKHVHDILSGMEFEPDFAALVDESGRVENGELVAGDRRVAVDEFSGELYSRSKRFELALERGDSGTIRRLMGEERDRVQDALS